MLSRDKGGHSGERVQQGLDVCAANLLRPRARLSFSAPSSSWRELSTFPWKRWSLNSVIVTGAELCPQLLPRQRTPSHPPARDPIPSSSYSNQTSLVGRLLCGLPTPTDLKSAKARKRGGNRGEWSQLVSWSPAATGPSAGIWMN